jgi:hypothetical protein
MSTKLVAGLLAATAFAALIGTPAVHAQTMAPPPSQMMAPQPMMAPMQAPPDEVDIYSDSPKVEPGDNPASWSARQNVADSQRYEQLVHTNPAFRAARIRKECGMFQDQAEFQQCAASFNN